MHNEYYTKILNWVLPVVVVIVILTAGFIEGVVILVSYIIYRFYFERDKFLSYIGKRKYLKGQLEKSVKYYGKACKVSRVEIKVMASYAYALILSGDFEKAREIIAEIQNHTEAEKVKMQIMVCNAVLLWKQENNIHKAVSELEKLDKSLRTATYYGVLGKMMIASGDKKKARKFNEEAYEYNSKHGDILENIIIIYCHEEEHEKAFKVAQVFLKEKPHTTDGYYYCGLAYEKNGKEAEAYRLYKKARKCDETILSTISHKEIEKKLESKVTTAKFVQ